MKFDEKYKAQNMMGPNAVILLEKLIGGLALTPDMRIMDLGCGKGLSTMALADRTCAKLFAVDLWISATENYMRFCEQGLGQRIIPIHADGTDLPFAYEYFDAVVSVDAYHYFGRNTRFMDEKLAPFVKKGGIIALAFPGLRKDIHNAIPEVMSRFWTPEDIQTWQTCEWWEALSRQSELIEDIQVREMDSFDASWADWLKCDNEYAKLDSAAMQAGAGEYMNFVSVICRRKK